MWNGKDRTAAIRFSNREIALRPQRRSDNSAPTLKLPVCCDLPENEQEELRTFIGQSAVVSDIDSHGYFHGYFWLGFGNTTQADDSASYSGHSFCVPRAFIEPGVG